MADRFWSFDGDTRASHPTAEDARATCQRALDWYRNDSIAEGWAEEVESIMWGEIREAVAEVEVESGDGDGEVFEQRVDYVLEAVDKGDAKLREYRDGRTYAYDDEGSCLFSLAGDVPTEMLQEVERLRSRAFAQGEAAGRRSHARDLRKLLDEGVDHG